MWHRTAHITAWAVFVSAAAAADEVIWEVKIDDPARGSVHVTLRIPASASEGANYVDLTFPDSNGSSGRISQFRAHTRTDAPIAIETRGSRRGQRFRVPNEAVATESIRVEYEVDPRFYPPGSEGGSRADARAIIEQDLGILRTRTIFAAGRHTAMPGRVTFNLPKGWIVVTPWAHDENAFLLPPEALRDTEYLGIGPFDLMEERIGGTPYRIASMGAGQELVATLPALIEEETRIASTPSHDADRIHAVILAPRGFIQGGSAGRRTVVQSPNAVTLAHEIFHWWNHSGIATPEARWFSEGFTEYFGIRAASASGMITDAYANACFADLNGEMRYLERNGAMNLAEASRRYGERIPQRLVYSKGALFAYWLDLELAKRGRELRDVLPNVFAEPDTQHDNAALANAYDQVFDGVMNDAFHTYVETATPLPDPGLPEATGETGRTRFPPRN